MRPQRAPHLDEPPFPILTLLPSVPVPLLPLHASTGIMFFQNRGSTVRFVSSWLSAVTARPDYWEQTTFNDLARAGWDPIKKVDMGRSCSPLRCLILLPLLLPRSIQASLLTHHACIPFFIRSCTPTTQGFSSASMTPSTWACCPSPNSAAVTLISSNACMRCAWGAAVACHAMHD